MSRRGESIYEERDYAFREERGGAPVRVRERERDEEIDIFATRRGPERGSRPDFLRDDYGRQEPGQLVVRERERDTETFRQVDRRPRSPSPVRVRERIIERSEPAAPTADRVRTSTRIVERRSPSPERLRARVVETRERIRERSPSPVRVRERIIERERARTPTPPPVRIRERERIVERERERTPSPPAIERIRVRNVEREVRQPSPAPPPSPQPPAPIIRAPPIHQEIITHHRHVDHGFEIAHAPTPPPPRPRREPPPQKTKETDIDIYTSRNNTEVDITKTTTSTRSRTPAPVRREHFYDDDYIFEQERDKLRVKDTRLELTRRRSVSARPPPPREKSRVRVDIRQDEEEADYYARKTNERAVIGEAYNGATKDWAIIDVPPGTERVRMDGVGGASEEITWQKYNGVRRSKFIPGGAPAERERERIEIRDEIREEPKRETTTSTSLEIDIHTGGGRRREPTTTYERDYERIEEVSDRRVGPLRPAKQKIGDLWTEVTKDLVSREAIEQLGYDYEETEYFYYILQYLRYEDVLELVELSEHVRRERRERLREIEREREFMQRRERERDDWERHDRRRVRDSGFEDERIIEREVIYDSGGRPRRTAW